MSDNHPIDTWPLPKYNPGERLHLHALGVISVTYASFERSVDNLYEFHPSLQDAESDLASFRRMSVAQRIDAIRELYATDYTAGESVANLLLYIHQCNRNRNELLHAEQYPPAFGGEVDTLYLIKRADKQSRQSVYMKFKLADLRTIADDLRRGIVQSAKIHIYLRYRGLPFSKIPKNVLAYVGEPPGAITPPAPLHLPREPER